MIDIGIVGGTGYAGAELLRLLAGHPEARVRCVTSRQDAGQPIAEVYPNLRGLMDVAFEAPSVESLQACDAVFFATPQGAAMTMVPALLEAGVRVIDISADFRLRDPRIWAEWYGQPHACPDYLGLAVYGLPEVNREAIRGARLVACPGCHPTAIELGLLPLLESGAVATSGLIADAKTGVSGAGRAAKVTSLFSEVSDSFKAYAVTGHRHLPEIRQALADMAGAPVGLTFVPHLVPMVRGIHATLYARLREPDLDLQALFEERFRDEPFVDVMPPGTQPETRSVRGVNMCRIAVHRSQDEPMVIVLSVIDNLVKGASGQALQNMNIMFGLDERAGLEGAALLP